MPVQGEIASPVWPTIANNFSYISQASTTRKLCACTAKLSSVHSEIFPGGNMSVEISKVQNSLS